LIERAREAARRVQARLADEINEVIEDGRGVVIRTSAAAVPAVLRALKEDDQTPFDMLTNEIAVDYSKWTEETGLPAPPGRFGLMYNLYSISATTRIFVEVFIEDGQQVPSAEPYYASANWSEREIFDMFGIKFTGHPDLRRIYMQDDFEGYPLRKEFPRRGFEPQDFPQE